MKKASLNILYFVFIGGLLTFFFGCNSTPIPKPRGYFRLEFPEKQYKSFDSIFPYKFYYPVYGKVVMDNQVGAEKYWVNIDFPGYKARIHISYKSVNGNIDNLIEDVRTLAYKHTIKADAINEKVFSNPERKVYGILYDIKGNAASSYQFYVTDSVKHFLRGALYFNVHPNKDSLSPAVEFFGKDMRYLIESLEWK
ncbi:MAG: gliding motility lipoprotein GldD [Bacteroidales bacterium]|nr:gliding motility lipoprotein GldD [Bacteroidales bacterium]